MPAGAGLRKGTRHMFTRGFRNHGVIPLTTYLRNFKVGDYVDIKVNAAIHKVGERGARGGEGGHAGGACMHGPAPRRMQPSPRLRPRGTACMGACVTLRGRLRRAGHAPQVVPGQDRRRVERDEAGAGRGGQQAGARCWGQTGGEGEEQQPRMGWSMRAHGRKRGGLAPCSACHHACQRPRQCSRLTARCAPPPAPQVGHRIIAKRLHVRVEHVCPSRCREDFMKRRASNDATKHEAKLKGGECSARGARAGTHSGAARRTHARMDGWRLGQGSVG